MVAGAPAQESAHQRTAEAEANSVSAAIPRPTMGWILDSNQTTIKAQFGGQPLTATGSGSNPALALDGAGNIDGAALVGGLPNGVAVRTLVLNSPGEPELSTETTVILLCGRENNWLPGANEKPLPPLAPARTWNVTKPGEWGLSLVSAVSPFAVVSGGQWVYANVPPAPTSFAGFDNEPEFPAVGANAQVCLWAFYDTSVHGSQSAPEISVAYDDSAAGTPVKLRAPPSPSASPLEILFNHIGADLGTLFVWQGSAATSLFQQSLRASYWNGGLRRTIASGFETPPWNQLKITTLDPRPTALGGDALDNVHAVAYPGFVRTNPFARYSVTVSANTPFLAVRYELGNYGGYHASEYSVSFLLDGEYMGYDQPWRNGTNLRSIPLPMDGKSHTLDLRNGFARSNNNFATPTLGTFGGGGFIDAVAVTEGHTVKVNHPVFASAALVLSHSVAVGELAETVPYDGQGPESSVAWPVQARAVQAFGTATVVDESYGGELLANDCFSPASCTSYIATLHRAQPQVTVGFVARMLNDFYHGSLTFNECLPEYERNLEYLFAAWQQEYPGMPLYVGSDIRQSAAYENDTDGCAPALKLADWRAGIETTVEEYANSNDAAWLHFVDMSEWVPQRDLLSDGIHPNVVGQVKICQAVAGLFHQAVTCRVPQ